MPKRRTATGLGCDGDKNTGATSLVYGLPVPAELHEAIEAERGNLSKAESLLGCLAISMEYESDFANGPYYPDVAQLARDLVRQSINGLDSLVLQQRLLRNKVKEGRWVPRDEGAYPSADYSCCLVRSIGSRVSLPTAH